ncbi:hypothetical protein AMECASPLE_037217 [Ameca splendens]|uniref:Uncharacterized protein n=1 Tax=Ameca splendens TaxID=208324 RepID=A0ABV0Y805_9TELE
MEQLRCGQIDPEEQDDLLYASVSFIINQSEGLHSNIRAAQPHRLTEETKVSEYAAVRFQRASLTRVSSSSH